MTTRVQPQRFAATQTAPAAGARLPGELWTNAPDLQIGFIDSSKNAQKLVAVRYFSAQANYAVNDFVINAGGFYAAKASIAAGAFNASQWTLIGSVNDLGGPYLPVAGGTLTGPLVLQADPSANLGAATKQYVDNKVVTGGAIYLPLAGGTLTGPLVLSGLPTVPNQAANKAYVDNTGLWVPVVGGTMTGPLVLPADPTLPLQASTKAYVDSKLIAQGDNRLINGDMRVDARNGGASGTIGGYTVDRWLYGSSVAGKGTWQRVTLPSGDFDQVQFGYCLNFTAGAAGYNAAATEAFYFSQPVEAEMCGDLVWGSSNAQPAVLSFWVSSTLTGKFGGAIRNYPLPSTRSFPFSFNIPVAQTWTRVVISIPPDNAGSWVMQGNAAALGVVFDLGSGANWQQATGGWLDVNCVTALGCVSVVGAGGGARFNITAVKFELGTTATPYPHQSPARNQLDCQRYFCLGQVSAAGYASASGQPILGMINYPGTMRVAPSVGLASVGAINVGAGALGPINNQGVFVTHPSASTGVCSFTDNWTASAEL